MTPGERFQAVMDFRPVDRLPVIEWAPWWDRTLERWRDEGLPEHLEGTAQIAEYLGLDPLRRVSIRPRAATCPRPPAHGAGLVGDRDGYEALRPHLFPEHAFDRERIEHLADRVRRGEVVFWLVLEGFFWFPRTLLGIERHLLAFHDQPDLIHRINEDLLAFNLREAARLCGLCVPHFMTFAEDMSYNHGPMISHACFEEFLLPYYRRIVPTLKAHGIRVLVDSDGDVTPMIAWLESAGIEGVLPLERMAGVDVGRLRRQHPRLRMIGAFDKTRMKHGEAAMRVEFERLLPVMRSGGFIPSVDHQTPPDVSLETYRLYVRLLKEYCQKAAE